MPVSVSYPGVYVQEIPSGVRAITGVSTSIAAFVGWAPKGDTTAATRVTSWAEYANAFGGLHPRSNLGYAVNQFFANGGQQAYIVRVAASDAKAGTTTLSGKLTLWASSEGKWSKVYGVAVKKTAADPKRFQLTVLRSRDGLTFAKKDEPIRVEVFENLSMEPSDPRYVKTVLNNDSSFVVVKDDITAGTAPPDDTVTGTVTDDTLLAQLLDKGEDGAELDPTFSTDNAAAFNTAIDPSTGGAISLLERVDLFNLLCVPGLRDGTTISKVEAFCRGRRAFLIVDAKSDAKIDAVPDTATTGDNGRNAALYYPWVLAPDPLAQNRPREFPPCGFVAGVYARTDASRGVWKAPAGVDASLTGVVGAKQSLTDIENGILNPKAVNCIRDFPVYGTIVWGARTLRGNDELGDEWKYVPVRRTALFLEETLYRALKWVVFEPNDEPLWAQIRLNVGAFMQTLFRQGAFQGASPDKAYFVKCDKETTTQTDINLGIVNIQVGFAPLKPAEFVVVQIQQLAGQVAA